MAPHRMLGLSSLGAACIAAFSALAVVACGHPSVQPSTDDTNTGATQVIGAGDGGKQDEWPGKAPMCTNVDPAKMVPSPTVAVPAGTFKMGCVPEVDTECQEDEKPSHEVNLGAFEIDKTEVTLAQYFACVKDGKCTYPKCDWDPCIYPDIPIACVKYAQAEAYCGFVGKRLPTEAEWEKAARGTDGRKYPWGNAPIDCNLANREGCGGLPWMVGSHPDNAGPYGALDMAGNVVEWCKDFYDPTFYATSSTENPSGPAAGDNYVGRGGSYLSADVWQRTSARDLYEPTYTRESMGIRCAK
jgi:formylglycine-generating enzyme required for sulfatase activity